MRVDVSFIVCQGHHCCCYCLHYWGNKKILCILINSLWSNDAIWYIYFWVNIGFGNDLLPDRSKPMPEPMLTSHYWGCIVFTWEQCHIKCPCYYILYEFANVCFFYIYSHVPQRVDLYKPGASYRRISWIMYDVNGIFLVTSEAVRHWLSRMTQSRIASRRLSHI